MQFDFSGVKASFDSTFGVGNWSVQGLSLQMTAAFPMNAIFNSSAAGNFSVSWMQNDSWVEGTGTPMASSTTGITWNTLPSFLSGADEAMGNHSFSGATSGNFNFALGLAAGFTSDITAGGIGSLRFFAADTTVSALFNARSVPTVALRPVLTVTAFVPEPSSFGILVVTGLMALRRKSK